MTSPMLTINNQTSLHFPGVPEGAYRPWGLKCRGEIGNPGESPREHLLIWKIFFKLLLSLA